MSDSPTATAARHSAGLVAVRPIRTFHPRRGRVSTRHADALAALWPTHGLTVVDGDRTPLDLGELFGRAAPRVLEIGFGMGESTAAMAAADPDRDYLAVEVHTPGIGNLLALVGELGLRNVRVACGDAMELVHRLAPGSLDAVHAFFPDPWPKARHHKRRLIRPDNVALLRQRLRPGGILHCATDWPEYAEAMADTLAADPGLRNTYDGVAPRPRHRPVTKFERRGELAGRPIADLVFRRAVSTPADRGPGHESRRAG
ncbi:tRNA (guanosine(46)-N7)-methyltransferase TrmB [Krasilnikovia cinnamomea]|nr:tRNA (guanosine(46)-N7)-methyltransferase TrmB [Krasilnikovia cinnamomea]